MGNVDVGDTAVGGFGDGFEIMSQPIEVDEIAFCGDRKIADVTSAVGGRLGIQSELYRPIGFVAEQLVRIFVGVQIFAGDGQDVVGLSVVNDNFGEGRVIEFFFVLATVDFGDAVTASCAVEFESGARQSVLRTFWHFIISAFDVGVRGAEFGGHFSQNIIEIGAVSDERDQRRVLFAESVTIVTVHILGVVESAIAAPDFMEAFRPFLLRNAAHKKVGGGDGFRIGFAFGLHIVELEVVFGTCEDFLAVVGDDEAAEAFGEGGFLAVLEGEKDQSGGRIAVPAVKRSASTTVN